MRSSSTAAPALFVLPWTLAVACGDSAPPAAAPVVITPSTPVGGGADAPAASSAASASATPDASASTSASADAAASTSTASGDGGARAPTKKLPAVRMGAVVVNGRLPPEVIKRIVRQGFGRVRVCYENGLKANPTLEGRVTAAFEIDRSGAVKSAKDGGSDLPDAAVVSCVISGLKNMSFPQPEGGTVSVVFPIQLALDDAPPPQGGAGGVAWGDAIGDAFGAGGLGLSGVGEGGGGRGEGWGGGGDDGTPGSGTGRGYGGGQFSGTKSPSLRQGATLVNGRLPPEVIHRIVRQNFGRFRLCYENGLRANPKLEGRIAVKFVIDGSGAVKDAKDGGSDLPDANVVACVVRGFAPLSFPKPESGVVTVVYPVIFHPGDPPPAPAPAAPPRATPKR